MTDAAGRVLQQIIEAATFASQDAVDINGMVPPDWEDRAVAAITTFLRKMAEATDGTPFELSDTISIYTADWPALADEIEAVWSDVGAP